MWMCMYIHKTTEAYIMLKCIKIRSWKKIYAWNTSSLARNEYLQSQEKINYGCLIKLTDNIFWWLKLDSNLSSATYHFGDTQQFLKILLNFNCLIYAMKQILVHKLNDGCEGLPEIWCIK